MLLEYFKKKSGPRRLISLSLLGFFLVFYSFFQSSGLTGGDAGDLVAAAALKGIPHPPGYPLYTFFGWLLTKLPIGPTPAWRVGLLSSLPSAFSVFFAFLIAKRLSENILISLIAALSLAFNYLFWLQAEVQEVFALHLMFLFLTLYLVLFWLEKPRKKVLYFLALIAGLEFSLHHTYILLLPAFIYLMLVERKTTIIRRLFSYRTILTMFIFFIFGVLFYFYVPLAASGNPPVNWGHVENLKSLARLILRVDYGTFSPAAGAKFSFQNGILSLVAFLNFFKYEFTLLGVVLILFGFLKLRREKEKLANFCLIWFFFTILFFQFYACFPATNWYSLATVERFYLLAYPVFFVCFVFGLLYYQEITRKLVDKLGVFSLGKQVRKSLKLLAILILFFYPLFLFLINLDKNDLRNFYEFEKFAERLLESCPPYSLAIVGGDLEVFTTSYVHYVNEVRPDLLIMSMYNPKGAIFYRKELSRFKSFFKEGAMPLSSDELWLELRKFLSENNWQVCSSQKIQVSDDYRRFPVGLAYTHQKSLGEIDYERIFKENLIIWDSYFQEFPYEFDPRFETFYHQTILMAYYHRAFSLAEFFFAAKDYQKARLWLAKAGVFDPESESLYRAEFLIDVMEGKCDLAQEKLTVKPLIFEGAITWPVLKSLFEKECLANEGEASFPEGLEWLGEKEDFWKPEIIEGLK